MIQAINKFDDKTMFVVNDNKAYMWGSNDPKRIPGCAGVQRIKPLEIPHSGDKIVHVHSHVSNVSVITNNNNVVDVMGELFYGYDVTSMTYEGCQLSAVHIITDYIIVGDVYNYITIIPRKPDSLVVVNKSVTLNDIKGSEKFQLGLDSQTDKELEKVDSVLFTDGAIFILSISNDGNVHVRAQGTYHDTTWTELTSIIPDTIDSQSIITMSVTNNTLIIYLTDGFLVLDNPLMDNYREAHPFMFKTVGNFIKVTPVFEDSTSIVLGSVTVTKNHIYISRHAQEEGLYAIGYNPPVTATSPDVPDYEYVDIIKQKDIFHDNLEISSKYMRLFKLTDIMMYHLSANPEGTMVCAIDSQLTNCHVWGSILGDTYARVLQSPLGYFDHAIVVDSTVFTVDLEGDLYVSGVPTVGSYISGVAPNIPLELHKINFEGEN